MATITKEELESMLSSVFFDAKKSEAMTALRRMLKRGRCVKILHRLTRDAIRAEAAESDDNHRDDSHQSDGIASRKNRENGNKLKPPFDESRVEEGEPELLKSVARHLITSNVHGYWRKTNERSAENVINFLQKNIIERDPEAAFDDLSRGEQNFLLKIIRDFNNWYRRKNKSKSKT